MIVGDSISQGGEGDYTWRYRLWQWLHDENIDFDFVGPSTGTYEPDESLQLKPPSTEEELEIPPAERLNGGYAKDIDPNFDMDHFSLAGRQVIQVKDSIGAIVAKYKPDYVLVELGFNDLGWFASGPEGLLQNMKTLIDSARGAKSDIKFAIANVPHRTMIGGREDLINNTDIYNDLLAEVVPDWDSEESPMELVHFRENYRCEVEDCPAGWDGLHPNELGEYTLAQAFSTALHTRYGIGKGVLEVPAKIPPRECPTPGNLKTTGAPYSIAVTWDKVYGARGYRVKDKNSTSGIWVEAPYMISTARYVTNWVDKGETWKYAVKTDCGDKQKSAWTNVISGKADM
ncbi:Fc.00g025910.m01.CDS01 [Cosmosporella sp. VM-42]